MNARPRQFFALLARPKAGRHGYLAAPWQEGDGVRVLAEYRLPGRGARPRFAWAVQTAHGIPGPAWWPEFDAMFDTEIVAALSAQQALAAARRMAVGRVPPLDVPRD